MINRFLAQRPFCDLDIVLYFVEFVVVLMAQKLALVHTFTMVSAVHSHSTSIVQSIIYHFVRVDNVHWILVAFIFEILQTISFYLINFISILLILLNDNTTPRKRLPFMVVVMPDILHLRLEFMIFLLLLFTEAN